MSVEMVRVRPAGALRRDFARWAINQSPKVRTVSPDTFGVPEHLVPEIPEELLVGSWVDGQRYVPVGPPPEVVELTGVDVPAELEEREAAAGEVLPPVPESAYDPDSVPLPDTEPGDTEPGGEEHACPHCPRTFGSRRGLNRHRQTHEG